MRRIKMLEFVLRMERYLHPFLAPCFFPDVGVPAQNSSTNLRLNQSLPRNLRPSKHTAPQLALRMTGATKRKAAVALLEAKVRLSNTPSIRSLQLAQRLSTP
jgi:hypothetical protein